MNKETIYRLFFIASFIALMTIRIYYQSKVLRDKREFKFSEGKLSLIAGSIASLTNIIFGAEYLFSARLFSFAYVLHYPDWLRITGVLLLAGGIILLGSAHHHLGMSFHSLVGTKEEHALVKTGPYRRIRHPIYTAYLTSSVGGGLLTSNIVLTFVPFVMYALMAMIRMNQEEEIMHQLFGEEYADYQAQTGRLLPKLLHHP
jgi:protein-S-isoprenylcysteine O-methyltransferase Ste14